MQPVFFDCVGYHHFNICLSRPSSTASAFSRSSPSDCQMCVSVPYDKRSLVPVAKLCNPCHICLIGAPNRCVVPTITPHPPMCICCHFCLIGAPNQCVVPTITPPSPNVHLLPSLPYWRPNRCVVPTILSPSHPVCNLYAFDKRSRFVCHHHPIFFLFEKIQ